MNITGQELLKARPPRLKFIFNETGIIFSLASAEHRDIGKDGITYSDSGGNALAGLIVGGDHIEIRGHSVLKPSEDRVRNLWRAVLAACPDPYLHSLPASLQRTPIFTPQKSTGTHNSI